MRLLVIFMLLSVVLSSCCADEANPLRDEVITREQRVFGLVTIYSNARQHFAYFDQRPKLDWDRTFMEYLPQVEKKQSLYEYYQVLRRFTALLEDNHTTVYLPPVVQSSIGRLPFRLDVVEGKWVITERIPTPDVLEEDIPPGTIVESIEGIPPERYCVEKYYPFISAGREQTKVEHLSSYALYAKGSVIDVALRYPDGSIHRRSLVADRSRAKWTDELRAKYNVPWRSGPSFESRELEPGILYIAFRSCDRDSEQKVVSLLESRKSDWPKGVILDLRANPGGNSPIRLMEHLIAKPAGWGKSFSRWTLSYMEAQVGSGDEKAAGDWLRVRGFPKQFSPGFCSSSFRQSSITPADIHYDGPLTILAGPATGSAAEHLIFLLKLAGRGTVLGDSTAGAAGQPLTFDLPGGGKGTVATTKELSADGQGYADVGCKPDVLVRPTIKGITEGRDEILEAALDHMRSARQ